MVYVISKVESEMHRTLLEVNFTDYKQASKEFATAVDLIFWIAEARLEIFKKIVKRIGTLRIG